MTAGAARPVADNAQQADWAPDGDSLVVARDVAGRGRLEYPLGKVLYETVGHTSFPRFSPKGDRIAFVDHPFRWTTGGPWRSWIWSDTGERYTKEWEGIEGLAWSPGGDEIWFTAADVGARFVPLRRDPRRARAARRRGSR